MPIWYFLLRSLSKAENLSRGFRENVADFVPCIRLLIFFKFKKLLLVITLLDIETHVFSQITSFNPSTKVSIGRLTDIDKPKVPQSRIFFVTESNLKFKVFLSSRLDFLYRSLYWRRSLNIKKCFYKKAILSGPLWWKIVQFDCVYCS